MYSRRNSMTFGCCELRDVITLKNGHIKYALFAVYLIILCVLEHHSITSLM